MRRGGFLHLELRGSREWDGGGSGEKNEQKFAQFLHKRAVEFFILYIRVSIAFMALSQV